MNRKELAVFLYENEVFDAFQFIESAHNAIVKALECKDIALSVIERVNKDNEAWRNDFKFKPCEGNPNVSQLILTAPPKHEITIENETIPALFYIDIMVNAFFQNCRNAIDMMAQAINAACLATESMKYEEVDFCSITRKFTQNHYDVAFPGIASWIDGVNNSVDYQYINMYCNRTKHTCNLNTKLSLPIIGNQTGATIPAFYRGGMTLKEADQKEVTDYMPTAYDTVATFYSELYKLLLQEIPRKVYVKNRYYKVSVFQQYFKDSPENSYSYAYIVSEKDAVYLPEKIQVMLATIYNDIDQEDNVLAMDCPFDTIYVKKSKEGTDFTCKYVCDNPIGADPLIRFRTYSKVVVSRGDTPLSLQVAMDMKQRGVFYHHNPYVDIISTGDDEDFINRVLMP